MRCAVEDGVFPGGVLLVAAGGDVLFREAYGKANLFSGRAVTPETVFDLASLTKPLATTLALMRLVERSRITVDQDLAAVLPVFAGTDKAGVRIRNLLLHDSGLPDYRPYYLELCGVPPESRRTLLRELLVREPLLSRTGEAVRYSDLGFMILSWVVEAVSGTGLDGFVGKEVYAPLGLQNLFFVTPGFSGPEGNFAATERCPWRNRLLEGVVHDENAYAAGGVEGHAGLFGAADDLHMLLWKLCSAFHGLDPEPIFEKKLLDLFLKKDPKTGRAFGFDVPSPENSSAGRCFSSETVGHLGFTGTSFWLDLSKSAMIILLTNRVHPSRENIRIRGFRPELHDAAMETIFG
jgi:CubicO group peptidase (beta-lactamase class C family)